jgi:hypothetical protein
MDVTFHEYELYYGSSFDTDITLYHMKGNKRGSVSSSMIPHLVPHWSGMGGSLIHDNISSRDNNMSSSNGLSQGGYTPWWAQQWFLS